jgi:hypothetical protein
VVDR